MLILLIDLMLFICCFWQLEGIPMMVQGVYSEDPQAQLEATTQFRKLLSIGRFTI